MWKKEKMKEEERKGGSGWKEGGRSDPNAVGDKPGRNACGMKDMREEIKSFRLRE